MYANLNVEIYYVMSRIVMDFLILVIAPTSCDDVVDGIADVARMLNFVSVGSPYW